MDAVAVALITKSLDALALRLDATAANIANMNSRGYRPVRVTFEDKLRKAAAVGPDAIAGVTPRIEPAPAPRFGDEPRADLELDTATATAGRYAALIDFLGRDMEMTRTAIRGMQQ